MITYKRVFLGLNTNESEEVAKQIADFCKKRCINPPSSGQIVFGAFEDGKLIGIAAVKQYYLVEPLVVDVAYPRVVQVLGEKAMAVISTVSDTVVALVKDEKVDYIDLLEKYGFVVTDTGMAVLKKEV